MTPKKKPTANNSPLPQAALEQSLQGRKIPASPEAEAAALGSMILDPLCIGRVIEQLTAESFSLPEHQMIFEALVKLFEDRNEIDLVLLRYAGKTGSSDGGGGVDYLVWVAGIGSHLGQYRTLH